jgi:hypothetical protein
VQLLILGLACLAIFIWFLVELGLLRGTAGPNRYGRDPLQIDATGRAGAGIAHHGAGQGARTAARFATIALLTLSGAALVGELALPFVLVQHGPWSGGLSAVSPRMLVAPIEPRRQSRPSVAPNEPQRQPQPPVATIEPQRQPLPPAEPDQDMRTSGKFGLSTST